MLVGEHGASLHGGEEAADQGDQDSGNVGAGQEVRVLPKAVQVPEGVSDPAVDDPAVAEAQAVPLGWGRAFGHEAGQPWFVVEMDQTTAAAGIAGVRQPLARPFNGEVGLDRVAGGTGDGEEEHRGPLAEPEEEGVVGLPGQLPAFGATLSCPPQGIHGLLVQLHPVWRLARRESRGRDVEGNVVASGKNPPVLVRVGGRFRPAKNLRAPDAPLGVPARHQLVVPRAREGKCAGDGDHGGGPEFPVVRGARGGRRPQEGVGGESVVVHP